MGTMVQNKLAPFYGPPCITVQNRYLQRETHALRLKARTEQMKWTEHTLYTLRNKLNCPFVGLVQSMQRNWTELNCTDELQFSSVCWLCTHLRCNCTELKTDTAGAVNFVPHLKVRWKSMDFPSHLQWPDVTIEVQRRVRILTKIFQGWHPDTPITALKCVFT